ncbi:hypothetical protein CK203_038220 [Vitis vinifera]|uniref:Chromo domain-containing protein n=1 Tax=Vitis vinifera TaxID=29760 RepID=A0A438IBL0_VITVI|nr:hypothetical protein CK203_038220 [Vitis vinifera]
MFDEARDSLEKAARRMKKYADRDRRPLEFQGADKASPSLVMKQFDREIQKILDHRTMGHSRKNRQTDFLVQWKGISETEASWERNVTLWQFEKEVQTYWQSKSMRASTSAGGGGKQGKPKGLPVQTLGAKYGDCRQVKRAPRAHHERAKLSGESESLTTNVLRISITEGSGHVCLGKLNRPPLPSGDRRRIIPDVRYPKKVERRPDRILTLSGMSYDSRLGGMSDATRRNGDVCVSKKEEATWQVLGRIPEVGGFSIDHHLGSGWLCKRFRAVMGGCITTKGKTAGLAEEGSLAPRTREEGTRKSMDANGVD